MRRRFNVSSITYLRKGKCSQETYQGNVNVSPSSLKIDSCYQTVIKAKHISVVKYKSSSQKCLTSE